MFSVAIILMLVAGLSWAVYMFAASNRLRFAFGRELFNPLSYNFAIYLLTGFVGGVAIAVAPENQVINLLVDEWATPNLRMFGFYILLYGLLVFVFSLKLFKKILKYDTVIDYSAVQTVSRSVCITVFMFFIVSILYYTSSRIGVLVAVFTGGVDGWDVLSFRAELVESEKQGYFVRRVIVESLAWIFVLYLATLKKFRYQRYILTFALSFYFLASLAKIKLVLFLISIFMAKSWDKKFGLSTVLRVGIIIFIALLAIWALFVRNFDPEYLFSIYSEGLVGRVFISEISALYPHLSIFGTQEEYLGASSISNFISSIFGMPHSPRSGRIVLEIVSPGWVDAGIGGVFNTVFFGEAYANFGIVGLFVAPIWVVFFYAGILFAAKFIRGSLRIAFLIYAALNVSVMAGFNDYLWNPILIVTYVIVWLASHHRVISRTVVVSKE